MIFGYFMLLIAIIISSVSAFYSISGLTAIFPASTVPIIIMGAALELGKITGAVWLHKYWHQVSVKFKLYLVPAIMVLMLITSMGVFGYLSKSHLEQLVPTDDVAAQVQIFDEKIKNAQDTVNFDKQSLAQLDQQVNQVMSRTTDAAGATASVRIRRSQTAERTRLQAEIVKLEQDIAAVQQQRAPLAAKARKAEAEVGPIKYIAALVYGDNPNAELLERAVRWVIVLLVMVFDPLAVVLVIAANQTIEWSRLRNSPQDAAPTTTLIANAKPKPKKSLLRQVPIDVKQETMPKMDTIDVAEQPALDQETAAGQDSEQHEDQPPADELDSQLTQSTDVDSSDPNEVLNETQKNAVLDIVRQYNKERGRANQINY